MQFKHNFAIVALQNVLPFFTKHLMSERSISMRNLIITIALLLVAGSALGAITGSKHDFTTGTDAWTAGGSGGDEICAYCHTPHNGNAATAPLWNKAVTINTFTAYGTTVAGTTINNSNPTGVTRVCLGCHDGSIAPGAVANAPNSSSLQVGTGDAVQKTCGALIPTYGDLIFSDEPADTPEEALFLRCGEMVNTANGLNGLEGTRNDLGWNNAQLAEGMQQLTGEEQVSKGRLATESSNGQFGNIGMRLDAIRVGARSTAGGLSLAMNDAPVVGGNAGVLRIEGIGYFDPDIVTFYGTDEFGAKTQLIQHVSQLGVMLRALPKATAESEPKRIGFQLAADLDQE